MTKIKRIEQEYGRPFVDVLRDLAAEGLTVREAAERLGLTWSYMRQLVRKRGVSRCFRREPHVLTPKRVEALQSIQRGTEVEFGGVVDTLAGHCRRMGLKEGAVRARRRRHPEWSLRRVFGVPCWQNNRYTSEGAGRRALEGWARTKRIDNVHRLEVRHCPDCDGWHIKWG